MLVCVGVCVDVCWCVLVCVGVCYCVLGYVLVCVGACVLLRVCWCVRWCVEVVAPFDLKGGRLNFWFCKDEAVFCGGEFFSATQGTTK